MRGLVVALRAKKASPAHKSEDCRLKKKEKEEVVESIPRATQGAHRTHKRGTRDTAVQSSGGSIFNIYSGSRKGCTEEVAGTLDPLSAVHENRTAAAAVLLYLWQHACITQQQRPPAVQIAGCDKEAKYDVIDS